MDIEKLDPQIQNQINELFSSFLIESKKINKIKHAEAENFSSMEKTIKAYEENKGRASFFPYLSSGQGHDIYSTY